MIVQDDRPVEQNIDRVILPVGSPWWVVRGKHGLIDFQSQVRMENNLQKVVSICIVREKDALREECGDYEVLVSKRFCTMT